MAGLFGFFGGSGKQARSGGKVRKSPRGRGLRGLTAGAGSGQGVIGQARRDAIDSEVDRMVRGQSTDEQNSR